MEKLAVSFLALTSLDKRWNDDEKFILAATDANRNTTAPTALTLFDTRVLDQPDCVGDRAGGGDV